MFAPARGAAGPARWSKDNFKIEGCIYGVHLISVWEGIGYADYMALIDPNSSPYPPAPLPQAVLVAAAAAGVITTTNQDYQQTGTLFSTQVSAVETPYGKNPFYEVGVS